MNLRERTREIKCGSQKMTKRHTGRGRQGQIEKEAADVLG